MQDLARGWKVLLLVAVAITTFLVIASAYVRATQRGSGRPARSMVGPLLVGMTLLLLMLIAFRYDFGWVVLGGFTAIGITVYILYVLPKQRVRRRYR